MSESRVDRDQSCVIPRECNIVRYSTELATDQHPVVMEVPSDGIKFLGQQMDEVLIIDADGHAVTEETPDKEMP